MFFGAVVKPGKSHPIVPHADGFALHLSQASLAADVKSGTRASVLVKLGPQEDSVVMCTLCAGSQDTVLLDQFMTEYVELSVQGSVPVHITGYYSPEYGPRDGEGDEGEEEEDEEYGVPGHPMDLMQYAGLPGMADSDDESEEGESGDEDEDDSMDESDEDESSDDDLTHKEPSVIIEDITDQENAKAAAKAGLANGDAKDAKKRKAAAEAAGAATKKQAVAAQQQQQQQQTPKQQAKQQQTPADKKQQQQQKQTPADKQQQQKQAQADKQQQQQQKTPAADKQQQKGKQEQQTPQSKPAAAAASPAAQSVPSGKKNIRVFENGFEIHNVKMGDPHGKLAKGGKTVKVRYVGRLKSNGRVFDKTDKKPFAFRLGVGEVIKGWDRGVEGMRVGDKRKLVIPPQMGYGAQKTGPIPANSWLEFDVELLDVK